MILELRTKDRKISGIYRLLCSWWKMQWLWYVLSVSETLYHQKDGFVFKRWRLWTFECKRIRAGFTRSKLICSGATNTINRILLELFIQTRKLKCLISKYKKWQFTKHTRDLLFWPKISQHTINQQGKGTTLSDQWGFDKLTVLTPTWQN